MTSVVLVRAGPVRLRAPFRRGGAYLVAPDFEVNRLCEEFLQRFQIRPEKSEKLSAGVFSRMRRGHSQIQRETP